MQACINVTFEMCEVTARQALQHAEARACVCGQGCLHELVLGHAYKHVHAHACACTNKQKRVYVWVCENVKVCWALLLF